MHRNDDAIHKARILIADDDPETRQILALLFSGKGYLPIMAESGKDALELLSADCPDVLILDITMPGMDGWKLYEQVHKTSDIPVLLLGAISSGENAAKALHLGAQGYLRKPFSSEELLARIESLLQRTKYSPLLVNRKQPPSDICRPSASVIIPTLNEAENLPLVLPYLPLDWIDEVILVDGCSTDDTVKVARQLIPSIRVVLERTPGKGIAMRSGYLASTGEIIIVMDADGSHDPREIPRFIHILMEGVDFAKGSRFAPGGGTTDMPRLRQLGNRFFVSLVNLLFDVHFTDLCYGYHAFWRYCLDRLCLDGIDGFEIDTAIYLRTLLQHMKVAEVPSFEGHRFRGDGKLRTFPDGWRVLKVIVQEYMCNVRTPCAELPVGFRGHHAEEVQTLDFSQTNRT